MKQLSIEVEVSNEILLQQAQREYEKDKQIADFCPVHLVANLRNPDNITYHVIRVITKKEIESWKGYKLID